MPAGATDPEPEVADWPSLYIPDYTVAGWTDSWLARLSADAPRPAWSRSWRYWLFARADPEVARWQVASLSLGGWRRRMALGRGGPMVVYLAIIFSFESLRFEVVLAAMLAVVVIGVPSVFGGGLRERELRRLRRAAAKHRRAEA